MLDIRLDFITDIGKDYVECMKNIRSQYMLIDHQLNDIGDMRDCSPAATRAVSLARTNLEISLQYAIKALCLVGEGKE